MRAEILVFDGFEDLDVFGPLAPLRMGGSTVCLVGVDGAGTVVSSGGVRVEATALAAPDVLVVPGGGWLDRAEQGAWTQAHRPEVQELLRRSASSGTVLASVCTGSLLLAAAGLLEGRPAVTNARALADLAGYGAKIVPDARVVDDGDVVTAGGLTAGLDLGIRLVERFAGPVRAREVARAMEYAPQGWVLRQLPGADLPADVPATPLAGLAMERICASEPEFLVNHSVRSYLFARAVAASRGWGPDDYDDEVVLLACLLHDVGLAPEADTGARFEVDGADVARDLLVGAGLPAERAAAVWEAVALHTSTGIAERMRRETALVRAGIAMDFGAGAEILPEDLARQVHDAWPRLDIARCLSDLVVAQAAGRPAKAPAGSFACDLVRDRATPPYSTSLERRAAAGRWGS